MDLTTAGLITGAVGFIVGSLLTLIIFMIVLGTKKSKLKKELLKRHEIIGSIGKKCAEIDHAYSEFRIGKIPFESLGAMILEKIEDVSTELNSNSDILDAFYIKNIERFLQDQKSYLMNGVSSSGNQERGSVRPVSGFSSDENSFEIDSVAAVSMADAESGIQEISAEEPGEEEFSVEPTDEAEEFHIEEETILESTPQAFSNEPVAAESSDSAFSESPSRIDMGEDASFDINATTILSVDQIQGAIKKENIAPTQQPPIKPAEPIQAFQSPSLEGQSLLAPEGNAKPETINEESSVNFQAPRPGQTTEAAPQNSQPFIDMDATQVYDQSMFQAAEEHQASLSSLQQQVPQQPKAPLQFEQPIPEPPVRPVQSAVPEQSMPQQPAFPQQVQPQQLAPQPAPQQQSLSAFDVEATQEFHVSDIMQQAQQGEQQEEIFEINMPGSAPQPQKPKSPPKNNDMVSGDDVANQMDNFFGFD